MVSWGATGDEASMAFLDEHACLEFWRCQREKGFTWKMRKLTSFHLQKGDWGVISLRQLHFYSNLVNSDPVVLNELGSHFLFEKPQCLRTLSRLDYPKRQGAFLILHAWLMAFPRQSCVGKPPKIPPNPKEESLFSQLAILFSYWVYPHFQTPHPNGSKFNGPFLVRTLRPSPRTSCGGPENWGCRMPRSIELVQIIYIHNIYIYICIYIIYIYICIFYGQPRVAASPILDTVMWWVLFIWEPTHWRSFKILTTKEA